MTDQMRRSIPMINTRETTTEHQNDDNNIDNNIDYYYNNNNNENDNNSNSNNNDVTPSEGEEEEQLADPSMHRSRRHARTHLRIASWNTNRGLLAKLAMICQDAKENNVDIILLQDLGIAGRDAKSTLVNATTAARDAGYALLDKTSVPTDNAGYIDKEKDELRRSFLRQDFTGRNELAILVRLDLAPYVTTIPSGTPETRYQHIAIIGKSSTLNILNVYLPPVNTGHPPNRDEILPPIMRKANDAFNRGEEVIMGGDWNAVIDATIDRTPPRANSWADEQLQDTLLIYNMMDVANIWQQRHLRTFRAGESASRIDTFIVPNLNTGHVSRIRLIQQTERDHSIIACDIRWDRHTKRPPPPPPPYKYATPTQPPEEGDDDATPQWKAFREAAAQELSEERCTRWNWKLRDRDHPELEATIGEVTEELTASIQRAALKGLGWQKKRARRPPFFTKEVREATAKRRAIRLWRDHLRQEGTWRTTKIGYCKRILRQDLMGVEIDDREELQQALCMVDKEIRIRIKSLIDVIKSTNMKHYTEQQDTFQVNQTGRSYTPFARHQKGKALGIIRTRAGTTCVTAKDRLQAIGEHLKEIHQRPDPRIPPHGTAYWEAYEGHKAPAAEIRLNTTMEDIEQTWKSMPASKAPGYDGITMAMLRTLPTHAQKIVKLLCLTVAQTKVIPPRWTTIRMILSHKTGDCTRLDNYRAIALAPTMLRIVDKTINRIAQTHVESLGLLSPWQFGFRPHKTTYQAQLIMDQTIDHARRNNRQLYIIMLDLRKAFPSVVWELALRRIKALQMTELADYIERLYQSMKYDVYTPFGITNPERYRAGILEGLSTSPMVFNIFLNPLIEWITATRPGYTIAPTDTRINMVCFADDGNAYEETFEEAAETLNRIARFGYFNNTNINARKTIAISREERDRTPLRIPAEYIHYNDRTGNGDFCTIEHQGPESAFRSLGIFRSINARNEHHLTTLKHRITHVLYNLERIPATIQHAIRVTEALIVTQLQYAAGLIYYKTKFIEGIEAAMRRVIRKRGKAGRSLPNVILEQYEICGRRKADHSIKASAINNITTAIRNSQEVSAVIRANMIANKGKSHPNSTCWAYPYSNCGATDMGTVTTIKDILRQLGWRLAWTEGCDIFNHHLHHTIIHEVSQGNREDRDLPHQRGILTAGKQLTKFFKLRDMPLSAIERPISILNQQKQRGHIIGTNGMLMRAGRTTIANNRTNRTTWDRWKNSCSTNDYVWEHLLTPTNRNLATLNQHTRMIIHTPDLMQTIDGKPGEEAKAIFDAQAWALAKTHPHIGTYLSDDAHEATWTIPRKHRLCLLIWDGRTDNWATMVNLQKWNLSNSGDCNCGEAPDGETIEHILKHCPLYEETRKGSEFLPYNDPDTDLKYLLGYVDADNKGKFGHEPTKTRTRNAKKAIATTIAIWAERSKHRPRQQQHEDE